MIKPTDNLIAKVQQINKTDDTGLLQLDVVKKLNLEIQQVNKTEDAVLMQVDVSQEASF
jgi:hypothetical protein